MLKTLVDVHAGRALGLGLLFLSSLAYRSQNKDVFGLWSWPYLAIVLVITTMFFLAAVHSWMRSRQPNLRGGQLSLRSVCSELAFLMWGVGYFFNGLDVSQYWGQIADLNAFGTASPLAALLLWGALLIAILGLAETVVPGGRKSRWGATLLAVWVTAVLLVFVEGGCRISAIVAPESQGYPTYTTALWARKFVALNQAGFRDLEHSRPPAWKNRQLLVVGDSLAFGWGLPRTVDRFGEQLVEELNRGAGPHWASLNASRGDTHTLTHMEFLQSLQGLRPDVTLLLYAFNDIDYLTQVTPRDGQSEHAKSFLARISPARILFKNSFLFQDIYVRFRLMTYHPSPEDPDPYENDALLETHFLDLDRFVSLASTTSAIVAIIPFNIGVTANTDADGQYSHFVKAAIAHGLPIWTAGPDVFSGHAYKDLVVNKLDSHPNELAHHLLASSIAGRVQVAMGEQVQTDLISRIVSQR